MKKAWFVLGLINAGLIFLLFHFLQKSELHSSMDVTIAFFYVAASLISSIWFAKTIRKEEGERSKSEKELQSITDSAQDAVLIMDSTGAISYWNPAAVKMFGYQQEEAVGHNLHKLIAPERYQLFHQAAFSGFQRNGSGNIVNKTVDLFALKKGGSEFPIEISLSAVFINKGWHAIGIVRDITKRKQTEFELRELKELADTANHAKSEFLANMSHELRTPMTGVIGVAELLKLTPLTPQQENLVNLVEISGNNLLSLINDVLDLSKIEASKITIEIEEFDIHRCIKSVLLTQHSLIHQKNLKLDLEISPDVPMVLLGDELRIKQVLLNLLGNAVKFTSEGAITVSVKVAEKDNNYAVINITVKDTGIGIAQENIDMIFKPFLQESASTTRQFGGTGLGLSITKKLVALMDGDISVESVKGVGSSFSFCIPFSIPQKAEICEEDFIVTSDHNPTKLFTILIVDDNLINVDVATKLLKQAGHKVFSANNGLKCLETMKMNTFDVILMDIQMPVMNGYEALKEIRDREQGTQEHQPVIALTAFALRDDKEKFIEAGFDGYIPKPFKINELLKEINRVVK